MVNIEEKLASLPDENGRRFVAVLNGKIEKGPLMNALGHMTAGLAGAYAEGDLYLLKYEDGSGSVHPNISHFPFIVLKAENSSQIRKLRSEAIARGLAYTDFVDTMTIGTTRNQLEATSQKLEEELEYYGICMFGETDVLRELTRKFSLFR